MIIEFGLQVCVGLLVAASVRETALARAARRQAARPRWSDETHLRENRGGLAIGGEVLRLLPGPWRVFLLGQWRARAQEQVQAAGISDVAPEHVVGVRLLSFACGLIIGTTWLGLGRAGIAGGLIAGLVLQGWPGWWLEGLAKKRKRAFIRFLPEFCQLSAIGVAAGLSLDRSMSLYCEHFDNPVSSALSKILAEIALGKSRRRSLIAAADMSRIEEFTAVVGAILRADKLGAPLAGVLRDQARLGRERHEELMRELSATAPVKMLGPIAGLILPALMIVILGPAILQFM